MAIEKAPTRPVPQNFRPEGGIPYRVKDADNWWSVARKVGVDVWDLIDYNFKTRNPAEVNWYLRRNVGCKTTTFDGKNYKFQGASPGIIYLPPAGKTTTKPSGIWFGIGGRGGGHFFAIGKETLEAWVVSYDRYEDNFFINVDSWRFGPGLGGSVGACLVIVTSCWRPTSLQGAVTSEFDFQANMAGRWGDVLRSAKSLSWVKRYKKAQKVVKGAITVGEWEKTRGLLKDSLKALSADLDAAEPQVVTFGIPFAGTGLELSAYYVFGFVTVHGISVAGGRGSR